MKRRFLCCVTALALLCASGASAAPGLTDNPVVTKDYLEKVWMPSVTTRAAELTQKVYDGVWARIDALLSGGLGSPNLAPAEAAVTRKALSRVTLRAASPAAVSLPAGTTVTVGAGASVQLVSGAAAWRGGVWIDVTEGVEASEAPMLRHKYIAAREGASVRASEDATVLVGGYYRLTPPYVPLYTDLCAALVTMGIVNTYELARESSRMEMMVIFLVLLGERGDAEAYRGTHPFTDVPSWAGEYVPYLYDRDYVSGTGGGKLSPTQSASVQQMAFLMLKALGYRDGEDISFSTALDDAARLGVFTKKELEVLRSDVYVRDVLMYMTYYSLFAAYKGTGERVIDRLIDKGQVSREAADGAIGKVRRKRPQ